MPRFVAIVLATVVVLAIVALMIYSSPLARCSEVALVMPSRDSHRWLRKRISAPSAGWVAQGGTFAPTTL
jgi:hypothetical protein